jgi:ArsR family transcriptional regulator
MESTSRKRKIIETLSKCESIDNPDVHFQNLLQIKEAFSADPEMKRFCTILEALGNEDRLLILDVLAQRDRCVCELEAILDKAQATVSHHIKILEDAGLIRGWKKGKFTHYSLVKRQVHEFRGAMVDWLDKIDNYFEDLPGKNQVEPKGEEIP